MQTLQMLQAMAWKDGGGIGHRPSAFGLRASGFGGIKSVGI